MNNLHVNGFRFSAVKAGIRGKDRLDLGLIYCEKEAVAAAVFTKNRVKAAPVLLGMERLKNGRIQAVMINASIANACTGEEGMANARAAAKMAADSLGIAEDLVLVSSTGVIGQQLDLACFVKAVPGLVSARDADAGPKLARAIMTTDTVEKTAQRLIRIGDVDVTVVGIAKGAGMIMPNMATMLCFIMTDVEISADLLQELLQKAVHKSFNRISIDGDSSTNDTALVMASGMAGNACLDSAAAPGAAVFEKCLADLCLDLALQIVADGEGASKLVTIKVEGARSEEEADAAARTIANSPLVKTAFFGQDANWGRIIAALGRSGVDFAQNRVDIFFDQVKMVQDGLGLGIQAEQEATLVLRKKAFTVLVDLKNGAASGEIYTCDFSIDYVKINADYRS
jgi:glutamate N-acetyltransferase/amino-acid N-acetyltransferase